MHRLLTIVLAVTALGINSLSRGDDPSAVGSSGLISAESRTAPR